MIQRVHKDFYEAGADIALTATYNAGIMAFEDSKEVMEKGIKVAV